MYICMYYVRTHGSDVTGFMDVYLSREITEFRAGSPRVCSSANGFKSPIARICMCM